MKALSYLQKVGAIPNYDSWDLLMSIVVVVTDFFSPDLITEPDILDWTQEAGDEENFSEKCDIIVYATSGDVRALFPHICDKSPEFLKGLLEVLIDTRLKMYAFARGLKEPESSEEFAAVYNDMVQLKGIKRFPSKTTILHTYFGGALTEGGKEILSSLVGTEKDFSKKVSKMQAEFSSFLNTGGELRLGEVEFAQDKENPFEGGYQVRLKVIAPSMEDPQECTLHWAPWPTAKTKSIHTDVRATCQSFTEMQRGMWLASLDFEQG